MTAERISELILKRLKSEITAQEETELQDWINRSESNRLAIEEFLSEENLQKEIKNSYVVKQRIWRRLDEQTSDKKVHAPVFTLPRVAAAAIIFLLLGSASYFIFFNSSAKNNVAGIQPIKPQDIAPPNSANAVLTLSNGKQIVLDSAGNGSLTIEGNVKISKLADGQIIYSTTSANNTALYNTLVAPRGSMPVYLQLADGSKVWLNAESSIHYPVTFTGKERKVEITGEAYFEVAHNPAMPFKVTKGDAEVQVLGTHFNINTYNDEDFIKVTLLEGSVKVKTINSIGLLKTGQQARIGSDDAMKIISDADIDEVMAWKNGQFLFKSASIEDIMKQAARWYDSDIVYEGKIPGRFVAEISRNVQMSKLLHILELTDRVHFKIDGKKITVMP